MPADRVRVQVEPARELLDVEAVRCAQRSSSTSWARRSSASARCCDVTDIFSDESRSFCGTLDTAKIPDSQVFLFLLSLMVNSRDEGENGGISSRQASFPPHVRARARRDSGAVVKIVALLLGLLVGVLSIVSVLMWASAQDARTEAKAAAAAPGAGPRMAGMPDAEGRRPRRRRRRREPELRGPRARERRRARGRAPGRARRAAGADRGPRRRRAPRHQPQGDARSRPGSATRPGPSPAASPAPSSTRARARPCA